MRKRIHQVIELAGQGDKLSHIYDVFMLIVITISLIPLGMKEPPLWLNYVEIATSVIFVIDYALRFSTADMLLEKGRTSFLLFPFTPLAIIDILSILPTLFALNSALRALKIFRLMRALRVLKFVKAFRYSKSLLLIAKVFKSQRNSLLTVGFLALGYILLSALIIFNVEQDTFPTFFDAVYWSTVSLTTVGYGDIVTTSVLGKVITMISSIIGIAVIALPSGIVTAAFMTELKKENECNCDEKDEEKKAEE